MDLQAAIRDLATAVVMIDEPSREVTQALRAQLAELFLCLDAKAPPALGAALGRALEACRQELEASQPQWPRAIASVGTAAEECQRALARATSGAVEAHADAALGAEEFDAELLASFLCNCTQSLGALEELVLGLERGANGSEHLGAVRRIAHTIKGEAGVLALHRAQELWHKAEDRIERCITERRALPIEALLEMIDWMRRYVSALQAEQGKAAPPASAHLEAALDAVSTSTPSKEVQAADAQPARRRAEAVSENPPPVRPSAAAWVIFGAEGLQDPTLPDFLTEGRAHLSAVEAALLEAPDGKASEDQVARIFRAFHTIKGVAGFLNLEPVVRLAHQTETLLDQFRKGQLQCGPAHVDLVLAANDMMSRLFDLLAGQGAVSELDLSALVLRLEQALGGNSVASTQPPPMRAAETNGASAAASAPRPSQPIERPVERSAPSIPLATPPTIVPAAALRAENKGPKQLKLDSVVNVSTMRLDALVDMVGELVIAQQVIAQDQSLLGVQSNSLQRNLTQVAKITRELQQSAMSLRMVTLKMTFQKMARLARDVGAKSNKQVKFVVSGEDTELDRNVVEEIGDPLVHLIRNAIDHGLEKAEDRVRAGKDPTGLLSLNAYHKGGSIVIEIKDDGRGLDRARIFAKARERGLIGADQRLEDMAEEDIFKLIFLPGFSTAEAVTSISGRGVGMDVVRRNIEALRGKIEIASTAGQGSVFTLRLPLTLAIIDGMVVRVGTRRYVIPTLAILQSFRPRAAQCHRLANVGEMVDVRDQLIRVVRVDQVLGLETSAAAPTDAVFVLVETHATRACLIVDEIIGQQQVVIKTLGKAIPKIPSISGGAILGDGRVAPILDIEGLLAIADAVAC